MKQTNGDKGVMLFAVREGVVEPILDHVLGVVLTWVTPFVNGRGALPAQNKEKLEIFFPVISLRKL